MKTSFVFVNPEIRKQKLHKKCNRDNEIMSSQFFSR